MLDWSRLDFGKGGGFVTVVTQDDRTGEVLMVARADREALERTVASGEMHYNSRTRGLWHKGATSGHLQRVVSLAPDCDGDAVLARVVPAGPACHTGNVSCFSAAAERGAPPNETTSLGAAGAHHPGISIPAASLPAESSPTDPNPSGVGEVEGSLAPSDLSDPLDRLAHTIATRMRQPARGSYTNRLLSDRNLRLKKLGEEALELAVACADEDLPRAIEEASDLLYHTLVALAALGASLDDVRVTLTKRQR